ncbi:putative membrane protein YukC [Arthrobacter sp. V1I9]|uniref:hypothetical protein n=1 Tax=Arthrobacter sp. V1I9 TaxID=3042275 RepID=UPI00278CE354|nr:hypothetical protein [Arthrobacter sp. V1I9]MDQ0868239.1 putative membrane protein YukC [Arthrobacter sp. V1I9]
MNRIPLQRLLTGAAAAGLAISLLTSCSGQPDLDGGVATQLQTRVAEAKQLAAQQDFAGAQAELDQLSQEVATAAGRGRMSQQRQSRIEAAIGTIRSELEATLAPAPAPAPATDPQVADPQAAEDQRERAEEAAKDAEEQREDARKEAEKQREEAQKEAEKKRNKSG